MPQRSPKAGVRGTAGEESIYTLSMTPGLPDARRATSFVVHGVAMACVVSLLGCETAPPSPGNQPNSVIGLFAPPTPQEAAAWATDPYSADRRFRGILLLANAQWGGEPVYVEVYEAALTDGDPSVRAIAARALGLHGSARHAARIATELKSDDRLLRWEAARALQRLHDPAVVSLLIERLEEDVEPEPSVRAAIATALGQYQERRVVDALIAALDDRDLAVNDAARGSLRVLTGEDHGLEVRDWVAWAKSTDDVFAGGTTFEYPVFYRSRVWWEWPMVWFSPPNERSGTPVGLVAQDVPPNDQAASESPEPGGASGRN